MWTKNPVYDDARHDVGSTLKKSPHRLEQECCEYWHRPSQEGNRRVSEAAMADKQTGRPMAHLRGYVSLSMITLDTLATQPWSQDAITEVAI